METMGGDHLSKPMKKLVTGFFIAMIEATITCPIERVKVFLMTQKKASLSQLTKQLFYSSNNSQAEMFRGFGPLFLRSFMNWTVFLQTDYVVKQFLRRQFDIKPDEQIPTSMLIPTSVFVALVNTCIVMPLDCIKTHLEKVNPSSSYKQAVRDIYQRSGNSYLGLFTGVRLRFLLYLTNALFVVNILEKLEYLNKRTKE
uniref:Uncharacterized protein n=1 Tax=Strombidium inclinatum TaxID=197538 RepID=A0A7S3IY27_9SPIT|mmetsp:Transcript_8054/g.12416  ORF Transcript_8054/g.12416 Transcript_8054/m.12416 type:complete len:199 (+) Transcript_8054:153-749(+)